MASKATLHLVSANHEETMKKTKKSTNKTKAEIPDQTLRPIFNDAFLKAAVDLCGIDDRILHDLSNEIEDSKLAQSEIKRALAAHYKLELDPNREHYDPSASVLCDQFYVAGWLAAMAHIAAKKRGDEALRRVLAAEDMAGNARLEVHNARSEYGKIVSEQLAEITGEIEQAATA